MNRGLKESVNAWSRPYKPLAEIVPMNRGLKGTEGQEEARAGRRLAEIVPMNRGLKERFGGCRWQAQLLAEIVPMNRGLKEIVRNYREYLEDHLQRLSR